MTNEEAIEINEELWRYSKTYKYTDAEIREAIDMAIKALKALEQEPCEDAISRQAVDILVDELARAISDERCCISRGRSTATIMQDILKLPSVTPQPKIGRWIEHPNDYECSECHIVRAKGRTGKYNYCPNCGARMAESEDKE